MRPHLLHLISAWFGVGSLVALLTAPLMAQTTQPAPAVVPQQGILVLRNGQVLHGHVSQAGDSYILAMEGHSEVRLPLTSVEFYCRDLEEAYARKCRQLTPGRVLERLELAQWCLQMRLLSQAEEQLEAAGQADPNHPQLRRLLLRLQYARHETSGPTAATAVKPAERPPSSVESINELSAEALEQFTSRIQPLLLNRCGASSCHGMTSKSQFRLLRPNWSDTIVRRFTQRNLASVLKQVDTQLPEQSPLLTRPLEPHGTAKQPVFDPQTMEQHQLLVQWVELVTKQPVADPPPTIGQPDKFLLQATTPAGDVDSGAKKATTPQAFSDPFDPDIFNRRYHGSSSSATPVRP